MGEGGAEEDGVADVVAAVEVAVDDGVEGDVGGAEGFAGLHVVGAVGVEVEFCLEGFDAGEGAEEVFVVGFFVAGDGEVEGVAGGIGFVLLADDFVVGGGDADDEVFDGCLGVEFADGEEFFVAGTGDEHFEAVEEGPVEGDAGGEGVGARPVLGGGGAVGLGGAAGDGLVLGGVEGDGGEEGGGGDVVLRLALLVADDLDGVVGLQCPADAAVEGDEGGGFLGEGGGDGAEEGGGEGEEDVEKGIFHGVILCVVLVVGVRGFRRRSRSRWRG